MWCAFAVHAAACGPLPTTYPTTAGSSTLSIGGGTSNVNGNNISGSGSSLQTTGVRTSAVPIFPDLDPVGFPSFSATTSTSGSPLASGSYNVVTAGNGYSLSGGTTYIKTLDSSGTNTFNSGTYYIEIWNIAANTIVNVSGTARIYIKTTVNASNSNGIALNNGGSVSALQVYLYPGASFSAKNNAIFTGVLYSPGNAAISFGTNATITGIVASQGAVSFGNNADFNLSAAQQSILSGVSSCAAAVTVDHYQLSLPTASLACLPTTVTVTACASSSSPCTSPATTVSGSTATLGTSGATLGSGTVTFNASGVATTTLSYPAAANGSAVSVTLSGESTAATNPRQCCPNGSSCSVANSCSTTFNTAGFIIASGAGGSAATIPAQTAGTASGSYYLRAVRTSSTTQACESALSGSTTVNWALQCNNPTTCSAANLMSVTGNSAISIAGNPNSGVSSYTSVPMTFDANGNAPFTFNYRDVGQTTLWVSKTVNSATLAGTSNAFVTKPATLVLSNIRQTASPNLVNPGALSAAGPKFVKSGESFSATVTVQTSGGVATPNFGRETSPEGVTLGHTLVQPGGGAAGALFNSGIAGGSFVNGVATVTSLAFSEVGIITLTPSVASGNYLGAGSVVGAASSNVGRFFPAQFALSGGSVTNRPASSCSPASSFTYLGETFRTGFTLTAQSSSGTTTQNYTGSFAKLDPTVASGWSLAGIAGSTVFSTANGRLALGTASGSWSNGVASGVTLDASVTRPVAPEGPFTATFGIAPADSDGVLLASYDLDTDSPANGNDRAALGSATLRYGRLRLLNAYGSELLPLTVPVEAQYWAGSYYVTNSADSCTVLPMSSVAMGNYQKQLAACETQLSPAGNVTIVAGKLPGNGLVLTKPGAGNSGSVDLSVNLGAVPTGNTCVGATESLATASNMPWFGSNPLARAAFGVFKSPIIYGRENY